MAGSERSNPSGVKYVLSCSDCLARYSDYVDGVMDAVTAEQWRIHLETCPDCSRYDRVLRRGVSVLRSQPPIELSSNFMLELQHRLAIDDRRSTMRPVTSLAAASIAVAAMLAFAAWLPVLMLADEERGLAASPAASAVASEIAWHGEYAVIEQTAPAHVHLATRRLAWAPTSSGHVIEPKYSPVVLESPIAPPNYARPAYYTE